jgi:Neuraminidase (sialidase)
MMKKQFGTGLGLFFISAALCAALDLSSAPGTVISHQDTRYDLFYTTPRVFISDPEILILSGGDYLASHALAGRSSGSDISGRTSVFRSTDKGATWTKVAEITDLLRASMIEHNGAVYLMGTKNDDGGGVVIARSTDNGTTWTRSAVFSHG